jgi:hypothetical protein
VRLDLVDVGGDAAAGTIDLAGVELALRALELGRHGVGPGWEGNEVLVGVLAVEVSWPGRGGGVAGVGSKFVQ